MLTKRKYNSSKKNVDDEVIINYKIEGDKLIVDLEFLLYWYDLFGKTAYLNLYHKTDIKKDKPINISSTIYNKEFVIDGHSKTLVIDLKHDKIYSFTGKDLDLNLNLEVRINDSIFFDTKIKKNVEKDLKNKKISRSSSKIMKPNDKYNLWTNVKALSIKNLFYIFILLSIFSFFAFILPFIIEELLLYMIYYILIVGVLGVGLWRVIKNIFSKYIKLSINKKIFSYINPFKDDKIEFLKALNKEYKLRDVLRGKTKIDLNNVRIKVVASNIEIGKHTVGSGKSRHIKTFRNYFNGIVLYEEIILFIPKNHNIAHYLKGSFSFKDMYKKLYPRNMISGEQGIDVVWEIQLIHDELIDNKIKGPTNFLDFNYFI